MRHSEQSFSDGTSPTSEHSDQAFRGTLYFRRSGFRSDRSLRDFFTPSASLPSIGSGRSRAAFPSGGKIGFHGQVGGQPDPRSSLNSSAKKAAHQRSHRPGATHFSPQDAPWLKQLLSEGFVSSCPAVTTATLRKSWRRYTACWCPAQMMFPT